MMTTHRKRKLRRCTEAEARARAVHIMLDASILLHPSFGDCAHGMQQST